MSASIAGARNRSKKSGCFGWYVIIAQAVSRRRASLWEQECFQIHRIQRQIGAKGTFNREMMMTRRNDEYGDRTGGHHLTEYKRLTTEWLAGWEWKWWVTLTFSHDLGPQRASSVLREYLNEVESIHRDSLTCLIAQEQKPAERVHFHLLIGSSADLAPRTLQDLWAHPKYGGSKTRGPSADIQRYDPERAALRYMLKAQTEPGWYLGYHNLELLSPLAPLSAATSSGMRRKLARSRARRLAEITIPLTRLEITNQRWAWKRLNATLGRHLP
jgi:hypothetical protein